ncbi:hypothetical protein DFH08DRAFT_969105 [Mycena albidolilacea]|uniref:Uncharacterized protein n=1 Tax=Mycena albidolilacea TaxID=1033008 RepID=A0AAD6ZHV7_9AGAR|nr:hypothetical protein DFH08DRAFT_969105 [Mycena albidolilacea]
MDGAWFSLFLESIPIPLFHPATRLKQLYITQRCLPENLIAHLQSSRASNITSFQAEFHEIDNTAFNKLIELLPRLTEALLRIVVPGNDELVNGSVDGRIRIGFNFKTSTFLSMLAGIPSLPPALERLGISWECHHHFDHLFGAYEIPDFPYIRDALLAKCLGMTWFWPNGFCFLFEWQFPMPDGSAKEVATTTSTILRSHGTPQ